MPKLSYAYTRWIIPFLSYLIVLITALAILSILIYVSSGANPLTAYWVLLEGGLGSLARLGNTLNLGTVMLLCSLGLILAFKGGLWNLGSEGQLFMGAMGAAAAALFITGIAKPLHLLLIAIASFIGGGIWGAIPAVLKVKYRVSEIISSLLMNFIAIWFVTYLVEGPWRDPVTAISRTPLIVSTARLPRLLPETNTHLGILIALVLVGIVWFILQKTTLGYRIISEL